ncbi:MAG TPA: hypothetical protein VMM54_00155 [Nitrospirota bacterium]|nr:hypothetical protein [Nitrospirota bacterium]
MLKRLLPGDVLSLLGYVLAMGIARYFLPYRSFSLLDLGVDATGFSLPKFQCLLLTRMPPINVRWE